MGRELVYRGYDDFVLSQDRSCSEAMLRGSEPILGRKDDNKRKVMIFIAVPVGATLIFAACAIIIFIRRRMKRRTAYEIANTAGDISNVDSLHYDFSSIRAATIDFTDANKLGQGGFGAVYIRTQGKLQTGEEIAVKRLSKDSGQGNLEFKNEVLLVAKLQHRNLVKLLGFSMEGTERVLIYEFVENASLDQFIFDPVKRSQLDWDKRYKIIRGIAKGLLYLHEDSRLKIIHRDLKASNILLDVDMNPKIADFGMARLFKQDETQGNTRKIVGTYGYMSPEYAMHGKYSDKSDVFSFGVLVLEILSGQRNVCIQKEENGESLLTLAWKKWREGTSSNVIDPVLRNGTGSERDMVRCIHIGLLCVQENAAKRPTMASVAVMLSSSTMSLTVPSQPAFYLSRRYGPLDSKDSYSSEVRTGGSQGSSSVNDVSVTKICPR
ncbi:cysteine-rich receptor-like protein kinase 44 [Salvia hispanica]|uniref:cysteine-rich receptor-like protein kinase 44 n=1 Tax=Salvia hispanica TaxID=49212 RepID=UPI002008FF03|nr:cysteine-rich receptor-like protein kinase 44 [Salvia hispanica]